MDSNYATLAIIFAVDSFPSGRELLMVDSLEQSNRAEETACPKHHHHQITEVYGTEAINDSKVRKWTRKFKDRRTNVHDEESSDRPSVITHDLMQAVETKIRENGIFTITTLSFDFPYVSRSVVHKIVTKDLNFKKLCSRWIPTLFKEEHKEKMFPISLLFLIGNEEEGDDILSRIVTGDET
ncbi:uncharacterized protein TNCV_1389171 [Trichonephila clavipes]|nr:uncharacterized protein TNCV_1389171 [Trichonephila clavipes]